MKKLLNSMRIKKRLNFSYRFIVISFSVVAVLITAGMLYMTTSYQNVMNNFAFPQGDIALAMKESAEVRSALRGAIGYETDELITSMKDQYDSSVRDFETQLEVIRATMVTKEGKASMTAIDSAWEDVKKIGKELMNQGATTDAEMSRLAQERVNSEYAPKYEVLEAALEKLMDINVEESDSEVMILQYIILAILVVIVVAIIAEVLISSRLSAIISAGIEDPLNAMGKRLDEFALGDLDNPFPETEAEDEIADMLAVAQKMAQKLRLIINDLARLQNEMAGGNFAIATGCEDAYTGAFNELLMGIRKMNRQMDASLRRVDEVSQQVAEGASNLSDASQALAEGAADQAATVEEIQATVTELNEGIRVTANKLEVSYKEAQKYAGTAQESREDMQKLLLAMERINDASEKIGSIITEIEDIASQTNLLSLNASIEAARAGDAGRGFAVVAEQIRKLAEQSAKSAVDSRTLIETSIREVTEGNKMATDVSDTLNDVVAGVQSIAENAKMMSELSTEQADGMEQANIAIAKISEVVQSNSATSEETSATSEELTAQAVVLSELVSKFTLRNE